MALHTASAAINRFGLGARPGEMDGVGRDPRGWLRAQLDRPYREPAQFHGFPSARDYYVAYTLRYVERNALLDRQSKLDPKSDAFEDMGKTLAAMSTSFAAYYREAYMLEFAARLNVAATTDQPFRERLVRFWSNHLVVPVSKQPVLLYVGPYERDVIRPHVTGKFSDMLRASIQHIAMLIFLDNDQSVGPNSPYGQEKGLGLNENLAREILELHTLGVEGGYTQDDVIALAKGISGWTIARISEKDSNPGTFMFKADRHEPGPITLLGKAYRQEGIAQGEAMLSDLARHPNCARFLATKLARHFVADEPPAHVVDRLARVYLDTDTDLKAMALAVVDMKEAWEGTLGKLRQPEDYVHAVMRSLDQTLFDGELERPGMYEFSAYDYRSRLFGFLTDNRENWPTPEQIAAYPRHAQQGIEIVRIFNLLTDMGQVPMKAPGPQGYYDRTQDWSGADSIMKRIEYAVEMAQRHSGDKDPRAFLSATLGDLAGEKLRQAVARAADAPQGITLVLSSPEFQRR